MASDVRSLDKNELKELLVKNWMTHDAMWFYHCLQECGIERTNRINRAAVRSMAAIEIKRIRKATGMDKVETFEDLKLLVSAAFGIVKGDFMDFTYSFPSENVIRGDMRSCFAYDGIKQMGVIDQYQCGIMERIYGWFDGIGIGYSVSPQVEGCMMHTEGRCMREFTFSLDR